LPEGEILVRHVWNVLPFGNAIVYGRIKGSRLPAQVSAGRQVDPDRDYVLVTNDFIADQWRQQGIELPGQGPLVREALIDWIKAKRVIE
jgi:2',3'-cyclic-nucleotide 2'-phosphodiesterase (5'-nucleotidase family)